MALSEHLEKLHHFHRLGSYRSLKEAAPKLGISQAGLSKSLILLEEAVGTQLLVRSTRGIAFTQAGVLLRTFAAELFAKVHQVEGELRRGSEPVVRRTVRLGTYDSIAVYFLPDLLSFLIEAHRGIQFDVHVDKSSQLQKMLHEGELDIAIGVGLATASPDVRTLPLFNDLYGFYVKAGAIAKVTRQTPLLFSPFASDGSGRTCEDYLSKALVRRRAIRNENFETLKSLTISGLGMGVLPQNVALPEIRKGNLIQTEVRGLPRTFGEHRITLGYSNRGADELDRVREDMVRIARTWSPT